MKIAFVALLICLANAERSNEDANVHKHLSLAKEEWQHPGQPLKPHTAALSQRYTMFGAHKSDVNAAPYHPLEFTESELLTFEVPSWADPTSVRKAMHDDPEAKIHVTYFNKEKCPDMESKINAGAMANECWDQKFHPLYSGERFNVPTTTVNGAGEIRPMNPMGKTGMTGRGLLGRWGGNQAADPVVVRCKHGTIQVAMIQRGDTAIGPDWALPGGMRDPNEPTSSTAKREFSEEANGRNIDMTGAFSSGEPVYTGYVDDPRNTDNAWMETAVFLFRNDPFFNQFELHAADDAKGAKWRDMEALATGKVALFASHGDFLKAAWEMIPDRKSCTPKGLNVT